MIGIGEQRGFGEQRARSGGVQDEAPAIDRMPLEADHPLLDPEHGGDGIADAPSGTYVRIAQLRQEEGTAHAWHLRGRRRSTANPPSAGRGRRRAVRLAVREHAGWRDSSVSRSLGS